MTTKAELYAQKLLKKYNLQPLQISLPDDKYKTAGQVVKAVLPNHLWYDWLKSEYDKRNKIIQSRKLDQPLWDVEEEYPIFVNDYE